MGRRIMEKRRLRRRKKRREEEEETREEEEVIFLQRGREGGDNGPKFGWINPFQMIHAEFPPLSKRQRERQKK